MRCPLWVSHFSITKVRARENCGKATVIIRESGSPLKTQQIFYGKNVRLKTGALSDSFGLSSLL